MARSLGDRCVKHVGVIAEPAVVEYTVDEAEDAFIIIAAEQDMLAYMNTCVKSAIPAKPSIYGIKSSS